MGGKKTKKGERVMVKRKIVLGTVIGLFCLTFVAGLGLAAPIEIKLAHGDPADLYTSKKAAGSTIFKQMVENETGGAVEVKLFPAGQLGNEREIAEAVKLGTIQMGMLSGPLANYFKEAQVLDIPYLFPSYPVAWKVMDGWFGKELAAECLKKTGMRILAYDQVGFRNFTNSRSH